MTAIPAFYGQCNIISLVTTPNPSVGIGSYGSDFVPVSLDQPERSWNITSQPNDQGLRFAIGGFPYTGVDNETATLISTLEASQDVEWYVTYREAQNAYTIEAGYDRNQVWTVSDTTDPSSPIVISTIRILVAAPEPLHYSTSQLFNPVQPGGLD